MYLDPKVMQDVSDVINQHSDLVNQGDFITLYSILGRMVGTNTTKAVLISTFTEMMYESGIDPLKDMREVPTMFYALSKVSTVELPEHIRAINQRAFYGCSELEQINIPAGVQSIYGYAFLGCSKLSQIYLPKDLVFIGGDAFAHSGLQSIVLPEKLGMIPPGCFKDCLLLESVVLPLNITSIAPNAFSYCDALQEIVYPGTREQLLAEPTVYKRIDLTKVRCKDGAFSKKELESI